MLKKAIMSISNLPNDIIYIINEYIRTLKDVLTLKHINHRWFIYKYIVHMDAEKYPHFQTFKAMLDVTNTLPNPNPNIIGLKYDGNKSNYLFTSNHLQQFPQLMYLKCYDGFIVDSDLSHLYNLRYFACMNCSKITPMGLSYLSNLESLKIQFQFYANADQMKTLYRVKELKLIQTNINDAWFQYFPHLKKLTVRLCSNITDDGIKMLNLTYLSLRDSYNVTDNSIKYLTDLRYLNCSSSRLYKQYDISDVSIQHLTKLTHLNCPDSKIITDISIARLTNLTRLNCNNCFSITDASISRLVNLTHLNCAFCVNITSNGIKRLNKLVILICIKSGVQVDDRLNKLVQLKHLETTTFEYDGSGYFNNLMKLKCFNCQSINGLQYLTQLTHLECKSCDALSDKILQQLTSLIYLDCSFSRNVTNNGLRFLNKLTHLECVKCKKITDDSIRRLTELVYLNCTSCYLITFNGIQHLNLTHIIYKKDHFLTSQLNQIVSLKIISAL
jgi:hypothetical protein